jgi:hypothetical protein
MIPGAEEVLRKGVSYSEARQAFLLTLIDVALDQCSGNQSIAARKLGVTPAMVNSAVNGRALTRFNPEQADALKRKRAEKKKAAAAAAQKGEQK